MVTKLGPLCKVKLLKDKGDTLVVRSPEKAGVDGSTPSLTNMCSINVAYLRNFAVFSSPRFDPILILATTYSRHLAVPGSLVKLLNVLDRGKV